MSDRGSSAIRLRQIRRSRISLCMSATASTPHHYHRALCWYTHYGFISRSRSLCRKISRSDEINRKPARGFKFRFIVAIIAILTQYLLSEVVGAWRCKCQTTCLVMRFGCARSMCSITLLEPHSAFSSESFFGQETRWTACGSETEKRLIMISKWLQSLVLYYASRGYGLRFRTMKPQLAFVRAEVRWRRCRMVGFAAYLSDKNIRIRLERNGRPSPLARVRSSKVSQG